MAIVQDKVKALIIGHAIGDALGVPVEFQARHRLEEDPVIDMRGYGTHPVPPGTWSDDTSMTLCLLESLSRMGTVDYDDIMSNFVRWMKDGEFTATYTVFDIGIATRHALLSYAPDSKLIPRTEPLQCGGTGERDNGNGSLMRIAPMALYLYRQSGNDLSWPDMGIVHNVSRLTHAHPRSQMACGIYVLIAAELLAGSSLRDAIRAGVGKAYRLYGQQPEFADEMNTYSRLWDIDRFAKTREYEIKSTGYVVDALEAVIWCLLNSDNYCECVLMAVNLGDDTDTVGAITGGLAGLAYGWNNIPPNWKGELQRVNYIEEICDDFSRRFARYIGRKDEAVQS